MPCGFLSAYFFNYDLLVQHVIFHLWQAPKKDKAPPPASKPAKSGGGKQKKKVN